MRLYVCLIDNAATVLFTFADVRRLRPRHGRHQGLSGGLRLGSQRPRLWVTEARGHSPLGPFWKSRRCARSTSSARSTGKTRGSCCCRCCTALRCLAAASPWRGSLWIPSPTDPTGRPIALRKKTSLSPGPTLTWQRPPWTADPTVRRHREKKKRCLRPGAAHARLHSGGAPHLAPA